jgi:hypothetical protein
MLLQLRKPHYKNYKIGNEGNGSRQAYLVAILTRDGNGSSAFFVLDKPAKRLDFPPLCSKWLNTVVGSENL